MEEKLFLYDQEFILESGTALPRFQLQYNTYGTLSKKKDNVVWVCHALTADANVYYRRVAVSNLF